MNFYNIFYNNNFYFDVYYFSSYLMNYIFKFISIKNNEQIKMESIIRKIKN